MEMLTLQKNQIDEYINIVKEKYAILMFEHNEFASKNDAMHQSKIDIVDRYYHEIENHFIYSFLIDEQEIGRLWLRLVDNKVHIFNIEVFERFRNKGYSHSIMKYIDTFTICRNKKEIFLYVFEDNYIARKLYISSGYRELKKIKMYNSELYTRVLMSKVL